jgi:hypothetical protein
MRIRWVALLAAVLCAACGATVEPGAKGNPSLTPSPSGNPSPTPVSAPLTVPESAPVIFFRDAANFEQVDGVTWDGVVGVAAGTPEYHASSPSETLFGTPTAILNRKGAVVNRGAFGLKSFAATWADDDVHFCLIEPLDTLGANGIPATLRDGSVEGGISTIMQVGKIYEQVATYVASCSFEADRAIVVQSGGQGIGVAQYWVVQVSTARVLWTHDFAGRPMPGSIVASHDSRYIAENYDAPSGAQTSTVYAGDGSKVTQFNASVGGFSWDDSTVVLWSRQAPSPAFTVKLATGQTIWASPTASGVSLWGVRAEPNGEGLAIGLANPTSSPAPSTAGYPPVDLYLLGADGVVIRVLRGIYW